MSKSSLPARRSPGLLAALQGDPTAKQVAAIQRDAFLERTHDAAQRDLAILKLSDIGHTTRHGMAEAADIAGCLTSYAQANPLAAQAAAKLADTGISGLDAELRRFLRES